MNTINGTNIHTINLGTVYDRILGVFVSIGASDSDAINFAPVIQHIWPIEHTNQIRFLCTAKANGSFNSYVTVLYI